MSICDIHSQPFYTPLSIVLFQLSCIFLFQTVLGSDEPVSIRDQHAYVKNAVKKALIVPDQYGFHYFFGETIKNLCKNQQPGLLDKIDQNTDTKEFAFTCFLNGIYITGAKLRNNCLIVKDPMPEPILEEKIEKQDTTIKVPDVCKHSAPCRYTMVRRGPYELVAVAKSDDIIKVYNKDGCIVKIEINGVKENLRVERWLSWENRYRDRYQYYCSDINNNDEQVQDVAFSYNSSDTTNRPAMSLALLCSKKTTQLSDPYSKLYIMPISHEEPSIIHNKLPRSASIQYNQLYTDYKQGCIAISGYDPQRYFETLHRIEKDETGEWRIDDNELRFFYNSSDAICYSLKYLRHLPELYDAAIAYILSHDISTSKPLSLYECIPNITSHAKLPINIIIQLLVNLNVTYGPLSCNTNQKRHDPYFNCGFPIDVFPHLCYVAQFAPHHRKNIQDRRENLIDLCEHWVSLIDQTHDQLIDVSKNLKAHITPLGQLSIDTTFQDSCTVPFYKQYNIKRKLKNARCSYDATKKTLDKIFQKAKLLNNDTKSWLSNNLFAIPYKTPTNDNNKIQPTNWLLIGDAAKNVSYEPCSIHLDQPAIYSFTSYRERQAALFLSTNSDKSSTQKNMFIPTNTDRQYLGYIHLPSERTQPICTVSAINPMDRSIRTFFTSDGKPACFGIPSNLMNPISVFMYLAYPRVKIFDFDAEKKGLAMGHVTRLFRTNATLPDLWGRCQDIYSITADFIKQYTLSKTA